MKRLVTAVLVVLALAIAMPLAAQGIGRSPAKSRNSLKKGANESAKEAQSAANKARAAERRDEAAKERDAKDAAKEAAKEKTAEDNAAGPAIEMPEDEQEAVPEPGETVTRAEKDSTIDDLMDMLKLTDKTAREKFKKLVRDGWDDTEKEDKRFAPIYKKADTDEKKTAARKEHQDKLKALWDKVDSEIAKQKLLNDEQTKQWKKASEELRTKTATDLHYEAKEKEAAQAAAKKAEEDKKKSEEGSDSGK
ncbi:MAG: hypothetical protein IPP14_09765 [Planctomycetes bacterium]|nr:hypothetical protein [Planctomycetota bacterium]